MANLFSREVSTPSPANQFDSPAPAGIAGSAGSPGAPKEHPPDNKTHCQATLPGLEELFPQGPLELDICSRTLTEGAQKLLDEWDGQQADNYGACVNVYPSGEITGGFYKKGYRRMPERKSERLVSLEFTRQSRKTIRRAVESGLTTFRLFVTLTFDPKLSQLDEIGRVEQSWAKKEFMRFLNTVKKTYDRKAEKQAGDRKELSYIWVAEIQEKNTQNIHFHILVDEPFISVKWLVDIWKQAPNSVNVKRISNQEHAVNYILKYMRKGHSPIEGKRYGLSQNLLQHSKPLKLRFSGTDKRAAFNQVRQAFGEQITQNGGRDMMYGFSIPPPRRARFWKDKSGTVHRKEGVSRQLGKKFLGQLKLAMAKVDLDRQINQEIDDSLHDVPF